ncbi:helix-turn-helix domain-containing protein [Subtercola sp. YIM 133946]|uniref:helix-turn-helix domain-containing protein n=1 Tax=Subtercola sp. YIM 133946 TaxID=3118909 RepID=UPI002F9440B9
MTNHTLVDEALLDSAVVAIDLLADRGYDATSVDDLADALEVSRSTFFRRFRTKEDIVFIDHAYLLSRLAEVLAGAPAAGRIPATTSAAARARAATAEARAAAASAAPHARATTAEAHARATTAAPADPFAAVNRGCMMVFDHHVSRPGPTLRRRDLLRRTFSLRERELVMSHRYERVFTTFLQANLPPGHPAWIVSAYAAAAVALNNEALRAWFDEQSDAVSRRLQADLGALADTFRALVTEAPAVAPSPRVVVALFDPAAPADDVLAGIREALTQ